MKKLFVDFSKLDENLHRNHQGTGLGLSICKSIIEQMGGNVSVKSKVGKGSSFNIELKTKCIVKKTKFIRGLKPSRMQNFQFIYQNPDTKELLSNIKYKKLSNELQISSPSMGQDFQAIELLLQQRKKEIYTIIEEYKLEESVPNDSSLRQIMLDSDKEESKHPV